MLKRLMDDTEVTSQQVRAARMLVSMEQKRLAELTGISVQTLKRIETIPGPLRTSYENAMAIRRVLAERGVEFIAGGVRLRDRPDE